MSDPSHRSATHREGDQAPRSRYREFPPPAALADRLVCTWAQLVSDSPDDYSQRVLPDGCVDLVWIGSAAPVAVGPATRAVIARLPPRTGIAGVRFRPGWAPTALGAPASEILDGEVELRELWGDAADALVDRLGPEPSPAARIAGILEALGSGERLALDPIATAAAARLARDPGARIDRLAERLGLSPRQLQRRFSAAVGYGPKTFQRIARFQRLLALARRPGPTGGLGQLALDAGYADQAHMTREVGALAGRTPTGLVGQSPSTLGAADLFGEDSPLTDTTPRRT